MLPKYSGHRARAGARARATARARARGSIGGRARARGNIGTRAGAGHGLKNGQTGIRAPTKYNNLPPQKKPPIWGGPPIQDLENPLGFFIGGGF